MDTKAQNLPTTHSSQPHSNSRPQSHSCSQCTCSHHCQNCGQAYSRSTSQRPGSHGSPAGSQTQGASSSPAPRTHKLTMHPKPCRRPNTHTSNCPKRRKALEGRVNRRKALKKSQQGHRRKRWNSGRKHR